ncbi:MAG: hypothetical protein H6714_09730 [Myxococcales bacterium]|nr:hypothetical protein [Myxococcales bacterium]
MPTPSRDPQHTSRIEARSAQGWLRIVSPKPAGFLPSKTVILKASLRLTDSDISEAYVNDTPVAIRHNAINAPVKLETCDEVQRIDVWVPGTDLTTHVDFYCDDAQPKLEFDAPLSEGYGFLKGNRLNVTGHILDDHLQQLLLTDPTDPSMRGRQVTVSGPDGRFALSEPVTPGAERRRLCAVDRAGHTTCRRIALIIGDFSDVQAGAEIPQAFTFSMGQTAVDAISAYVEQVVNARDFSSMLLSLNPLASAYSNQGTLYYAIRATGFEHGGIKLQTYLRNGALEIRASVYHSRVSFAFLSDIVPDASGSVYVREITANFTARPYAQDGRPQVELSWPSVSVCPNLDDCALSMSNEFYHQVAQAPVIRQVLRQKAQDTLRGELHRHAQAALRQALEIELAKDIAIAGVRGRVSGTLERFDANGSVLQMSGSVGIRAADPIMFGPGTLVNARRAQAPLTLSGGNVAAAVSSDLVNAGLYTAWASGYFNQQLIQPNFGGESLTVGELSSLLPVSTAADPQSTVRFDVITPLPPVLRQTRDNTVTMLLPDMRVKAVSQQEPEVVLFELSLALRAQVVIVADSRSVRIDPVSFTLAADATQAVESFPNGPILDEVLTTLFEEELKSLLNHIGPIPIPSMPPFHIENVFPIMAPDYFAYHGSLYYGP